VLILGVVKFWPVNKRVPPVAASYHLYVVHPVALKLTVPVPHLEAGTPVGADGIGLTVIITVDIAGGQGPVGSFVVNVSVTVPVVILGVYVDVRELGSEKVPLGAVHDPLVALPPTDPASVIVPPAHTDCAGPAFAVATGLIIIVT
jgi:hypothetical protein